MLSSIESDGVNVGAGGVTIGPDAVNTGVDGFGIGVGVKIGIIGDTGVLGQDCEEDNTGVVGQD